LAIALQIVMSFGHAHRIEGFRPAGLAQAAGIPSQPAIEPGDPGSPPPALPFEYCAICVVIKMGAAMVPAEAPASTVPVVSGKVRFAAYAEAAISTSGHLLFQARGPPSA
jgi:hypothetical protein